jgi:hypothetical protein
MFENAARKNFQWSCTVGGERDSDRRGRYRIFRSGMGCALDDNHVLTARHCWTNLSSKCSWPVVARQDGSFRASVVFESLADDIVLYRLTERFDAGDERFKDYPRFSKRQLSVGAPVGFFFDLMVYKLPLVHFATGAVSMRFPDNNGDKRWFALSCTVVQQGISGSAVFRPDGSIVGVVTNRLSFTTNIGEKSPARYVMPIVSPIGPVRQDIESILSGSRRHTNR